MRRSLALVLMLVLPLAPVRGDEPLRVFICDATAGDEPARNRHLWFLTDWTALLAERGAVVDGGGQLPSRKEFENTDVLILYGVNAATISEEQRPDFQHFIERGGGLVVIHNGISGDDPHWFKGIAGVAWEHGHSKSFEGDVSLYYQGSHAITSGASNFDLDDAVFWDIHMAPEVRILATAYAPDPRQPPNGRLLPSVHHIAPQMWTYETSTHRAFVSLPGRSQETLALPHYRAVLLRGIAWAGRRDSGLLVRPEELATLRYPEGGPAAPERAARGIAVHPEFDLRLVAAEPLIQKPIAHDWDAAGRLWVAETPEYPFRTDRTRPARDRISILSDTNGDGSMDSKQVFCDELELVTSFVFFGDGVLVAQAPQILWLRDTTGDGVADAREVVFSGFGVFDTHAVISNMRWGIDGWIYMTQGYSGAVPQNAEGRVFGRMGSGVLRFRPDGSDIQMVSSKNGNTWGLDFGWDGELFFSQANGHHVIHVVLPEYVLERGHVRGVRSWNVIEDHKRVFPIRTYAPPYVQIDHAGGFTAASGATIYNGGAWPADWDYNYFVSEPTVNLVHRDVLVPRYNTFSASKARGEEEGEFIAATDLWFRPIHGRVGPDGALYLLDFYNQAIIHNDPRGLKHGPGTAAERPDRDQYFGRVWRVQHREARILEVPDLAAATPEGLAAALDHPNDWVRMTAHRLIVEGGLESAVPALVKLATSRHPPQGRIHALWVLAKLGAFPPEKIESLIADPDPVIRRHLLRIVAEVDAPSFRETRLVQPILACLEDTDSPVQLRAILALGEFPLTLGIAADLARLYPTLPDSWAKIATLSVTASNPLLALQVALSGEEQEGLSMFVTACASQLAASRNPHAWAKAIGVVANSSPENNELKVIVLRRFADADAAGFDNTDWAAAVQEPLRSLLHSGDSRLALAALALADRWDGAGDLQPDIHRIVERGAVDLADASLSEEQRLGIAEALLAIRHADEATIGVIIRILLSDGNGDFKRRLLDALGKTETPAVTRALVEVAPGLDPSLRDTLMAQITRRADRALAFLDGVQEGRIPADILDPGAVQRLKTHPDPEVARLVGVLLDKLRVPEIRRKDERMVELLAALREGVGDHERGRAVFEQHCSACHHFRGTGRRVGPDLAGMHRVASGELIEHIIDPNRRVEPNFATYTVQTRSGELFYGIIARESAATVVLQNAAGEVQIRQADITARQNTGMSLMPEGFGMLGTETLRDLLAYLRQPEEEPESSPR